MTGVRTGNLITSVTNLWSLDRNAASVTDRTIPMLSYADEFEPVDCDQNQLNS